MRHRLIIKNLTGNKAVTLAVILFVTIAAALLSLATALGTNLFGAIDQLMLDAKTPHYMQMHSGDLDYKSLEQFAAKEKEVEAFQVLPFLGVDNDQIAVEGKSIINTLQDNGFCTQSDEFDFLLDMDGNPVKPADGELYAPVFYNTDGTIAKGDTVTVKGIAFKVVGFVRDSQMNSALAYSKRFVVSDNDYARLAPLGNVEHLIEFRLNNIDNLDRFAAAYSAAEMPANGPALTWPLFRTLSAISDGIMIAVILLVTLLIILIALLCVRFTLLAKIEEDFREIGTMKAIGMSLADIRRLYLFTYGTLAAIGVALGLLISSLLYGPILANIRLHFGDSPNQTANIILSIILVLSLYLLILLYVRVNLRRFRKLSAVSAIQFGISDKDEKNKKTIRLSGSRYLPANLVLGMGDVFTRKRLYTTMLVVAAIAAFIIIVPQNLYNTISSKDFVSNMGVGRCELRVDIQRSDSMDEKTDIIEQYIKDDTSVSDYTVLTTKTFGLKHDNGVTENMKVELGNHDVFPITYVKGRTPLSDQEIALSSMNADQLEKGVGDQITLLTSDGEKSLTICGIYSDITNGGKTAKAIFRDNAAETAWSVACVSFKDSSDLSRRLPEYKSAFNYARVSSIDEYVTQTFGQTLNSVRTASVVSIGVAVAVTLLVILLFLKLLTAKDRYHIASLKVIGFTNTDIKKQFAWRMLSVLLLGIVLGTILAGTLGEKIAAIAVSSFGASAFRFEPNLYATYLFCPVILILTALLAIAAGTKKIGMIHIAESIKEF